MRLQIIVNWSIILLIISGAGLKMNYKSLILMVILFAGFIVIGFETMNTDTGYPAVEFNITLKTKDTIYIVTNM